MKKYAAEFVGTFVLVLGGVGSAVLAGDKIGFAGVALAFGLSLLAMAYSIGPISGCHINPAVTLGLLLAGKMKRRDAIPYVVAQIAGGLVATLLVLAIAKGGPGGYDAQLSGLAANGFGAHSPGGYSVGAAFLTEIVLTFVLVFTVLGTTDVKAPVGFAGLAIGLVLTLIHLVGIPVTNTSVNPARSIGPALFVGGWALEQLWLFVIAPLAGAALASAVYLALRHSPTITAAEAESALPRERADRARAAGETSALA
jgi:aquaporin Z